MVLSVVCEHVYVHTLRVHVGGPVNVTTVQGLVGLLVGVQGV